MEILGKICIQELFENKIFECFFEISTFPSKCRLLKKWVSKWQL